MTFSYQNLNEDRPRGWSYGRIWLRRRGDWYQARCGTLRVEWCVPCSHCGWSVAIGCGDSGADLGITCAIPLLLTLHVTLERAFVKAPFAWDFDRGQDRRIGCYFHANAFWYHIWVGSMASWSRKYPWCRWWRQGSFHFANLLGKQRHSLKTLQRDIPLVIPMPEGAYRAVAKIEQRTWKRPLWFATTRTFVDVTIPKGIPFAGKGENSWDCGDDGLFGYGVEGTSLEKAIAHGVESVLNSRKRYGKPSQAAINAAVAK